MKTTMVILLILLAIGMYPDYAHKVVNAATDIVCNLVTPNRSGLELVILLGAIIVVARCKF